MRYLGGKYFASKHIAPIINHYTQTLGRYVEPFCGACNVTVRVVAEQRIASDANRFMSILFMALQQGWQPPTEVSRELYNTIKADPKAYDPWLVAFVAVGCSFGGKWWGGYAEYNPNGAHVQNYPMNAHNSLLKQRAALQGVHFTYGSYRRFDLEQGSVIYCDPPYANTTGYAAVGAFDSAAFWQWAKYMAQTNIVLVSEYVNPCGYPVLWEKGIRQNMHTKADRKPRQEKLILVQP